MFNARVVLLFVIVSSFAYLLVATPIPTDEECTEFGCRTFFKKQKGFADVRDLSSWKFKLGKLAIHKTSATSTLSKADPGILAKILGMKHDDTSSIASRTNVQYGPLDIRHAQMTNTYYRPRM